MIKAAVDGALGGQDRWRIIRLQHFKLRDNLKECQADQIASMNGRRASELIGIETTWSN